MHSAELNIGRTIGVPPTSTLPLGLLFLVVVSVAAAVFGAARIVYMVLRRKLLGTTRYDAVGVVEQTGGAMEHGEAATEDAEPLRHRT